MTDRLGTMQARRQGDRIPDVLIVVAQAGGLDLTRSVGINDDVGRAMGLNGLVHGANLVALVVQIPVGRVLKGEVSTVKLDLRVRSGES